MGNLEVKKLVDFLEDYKDCSNPDLLIHVLNKTLKTLKESINEENTQDQESE